MTTQTSTPTSVIADSAASSQNTPRQPLNGTTAPPNRYTSRTEGPAAWIAPAEP